MVREYEIDYSENIINFKDFFEFLFRNLKRISIFSIIGILFTSFLFIGNKKTYTGQFQIVLEGEKKDSMSEAKSAIKDLIGLSTVGGGQSLKTELEILKSPYVLLNVFEFIKEYDPNSYNLNKLTFDDWSKQIEAKFKLSTTVLNVKYSDQNKNNILPVLKKISNTYQDYSGRARRRELELSLDYFKNQIGIYKKKTLDAFEESDNFAAKYDLKSFKSGSNFIQFGPGGTKVNSAGEILNIENQRTQQSSKIREINEFIKIIEANKNNPEQLLNLSTIVEDSNFSNQDGLNTIRKKIFDINLNLSKLRKIYNENDKLIQEYLKRKEILNERLYIDTLNSLTASKKQSEATLKSLERPIGVITKYKELIRTAGRNEGILTQLEDQLRIYSLEDAKYKDPWKLITNPKIDKFPKPQYKLRKLLIGLISGFLIGCLIAKSREKIRNKIISEFDIRNIFGGISVETFDVSEKDIWKESIQFLSNGFLSKYQGEIKILNVDISDTKDVQLLLNLLNKNLSNIKITYTDSILDAFEKNNFLICVESSSTSIKNLEKIKKNITLQNKNLIGIIFINKEYKLKDYYLINKIFSIVSK